MFAEQVGDGLGFCLSDGEVRAIRTEVQEGVSGFVNEGAEFNVGFESDRAGDALAVGVP